jgi:hypothetical protein
METSDENNETTQKGDDLSSFILPLGSKAGTLSSKTNALPSSSSLVDSEARDTERRHEIVALLPGGGETGWHLLLNYRNWNAIRGRIDEDAPTMVISFLGDTEVGKSHTIRELMSDGEERPFVQRGADQRASTTSNVNLFECRSLVPGVTVNLLDFEGENGSEATVVGGSGATSRKGSGSGGTASALGIGLAASAGVGGATGSSSLLSSALNRSSSRPPSASSSSSSSSSLASSQIGLGLGTRSEAVREYFPRLAYTTSDVVVMVGTDPFFSTRYLERVVEFARRANAGVTDVDLPVLLLVSNKRDGDRCVLDIQLSTQQFTDACGDAFRTLDQYFSALVCVYLPNKRNKTVDENGNVFDGAEMFAQQIDKLKRLLAALMRARLVSRYENNSGGGGQQQQSRLITSKQGLWFELVPRVIRELNSGRQVHVTRLVDESWSAAMSRTSGDRESANDVMKSFVSYLRPKPSLSQGAKVIHEDFLRRFDRFCSLCCAIAVRIAAARLRSVDPAYRIDSRVRSFAKAQIEAMKLILEDVAPCRALYSQAKLAPGESLGFPVDRPDEPVLCLLENRVHSKGHRSNRRVRGGGKSVWQKMVGNLLPYTPAWEGQFDTGGAAAKASRALKSIDEMVNDVVVLTNMSTGDYLASLRMLQRAYSNNGVEVTFSPLSAEDANEISQSSSSNPTVLLTIPVEVKAEPLPRDAVLLMPYCIGCADKIVSVQRTSEDGKNASHDDAVVNRKQAEKASKGGWLQAIVGNVLETVGLASSESIKAVPGAPSELYDVPSTTVIEGSAQQTVVLAFCGSCLKSLSQLKR